MAVDANRDRLYRTTAALDAAGIPYAVIRGWAVASWVARRDPDATRTTKDVDLLIQRQDLERAKKAILQVGLLFEEVAGVAMFLEPVDPSPKRAVHLIWAGEKVRDHEAHAAPNIEERHTGPEGFQVLDLLALIKMKLMAYRHLDQAHLCDMIDVGLIDREILNELPPDLAARLEPLLVEMGR